MSLVNPILNDLVARETISLKKDYIKFQEDLSSYLWKLESRIDELERKNIVQETNYISMEKYYKSHIANLECELKQVIESIDKKYKSLEKNDKSAITKKPIEESLNILSSNNRYDALGWKNVKNKRKK